jgi:hypothetical protein
MPLNVTLTPPRDVGSVAVVAFAAVAPGYDPKIDTSEPGATADPLPLASLAKLAAFVTPLTTTLEAAALTVSATEMVCGLLAAPVAVTVIAPLYGPGVKLAGVTEIVRFDGEGPEGVTESHAAFELADHARVPPPEVEIDIDCGEGAAPPTVYVNVAWLVESEIEGATGEGAVAVRVTDMV